MFVSLIEFGRNVRINSVLDWIFKLFIMRVFILKHTKGEATSRKEEKLGAYDTLEGAINNLKNNFVWFVNNDSCCYANLDISHGTARILYSNIIHHFEIIEVNI